jgi:hypothetical protein
MLPVWQIILKLHVWTDLGAGQADVAGNGGAAPNVIQAITENVCGRAWIYATLML